MSTVIAVVTHKEYTIPGDPLYIPLMAGSALMGHVPDGYVRDDTGDNISALNRSYCELTGLYWAWKNLDADYIGICHYRRYFASKMDNTSVPFGSRVAMYAGMKPQREILGMREAEMITARSDVILPVRRRYYIETNYSQYAHAHHAQDLDITRDIIRERHPQYLSAFDRQMKKRSGHRFNMFIMKREVLDSYCTWLFDTLFELERRIDTSGYSERDKRVFGFVAERLLDVWLDANGCEYTEMPYVMTERENLPLKAEGLIARKIRAAVHLKTR